MPPSAKRSTRSPLLVIDGDSFAHRSYHALPKSIRRAGNRGGGAVLGFANFLLRLVASEKPRAVIVGWDTLEAETYRQELFPDYQGGREFDDELVEQLEALPGFVAACGFANAKGRGYEADDFLAAAAKREERNGGTVLVASGDRDAFQLASERTMVLYPLRAGEMARIGPAEVRERYGVDPEQVPDFIALRGDPSDRLPGARGVGAKGAADLLRRYGSLERVLASGRFAAQADDLRLYKQIATMNAKAPLPKVGAQTPTWDKAAALAREWGLNQLAARLDKLAGVGGHKSSPSPLEGEGREGGRQRPARLHPPPVSARALPTSPSRGEGKKRTRVAALKIATFNINDINKRLPNLLAWLGEAKPDIVALQETKTTDPGFPSVALERAGYRAIAKGERTYNGVAILARSEPHVTRRALPGDAKDTQSRYLEAAITGVLFTSIYSPNGNPQPGPKFDYKLAWMKRLIAHARTLYALEAPVVLAGDFNVVPTDRDIYRVRSWKKDALLQPAPRALFRELLGQGWVDAVRTRHPDAPIYTYWDYKRECWPRDAGLRIDFLLLNAAAAARLVDAGVDKKVRGEEGASDHAPAWVKLRRE
ncbi:MAG TPA: exodeoxyribonuclease III [Stellaceae bacterium]|nr:exodeoxyribonuclease III [Stellaceae bacterium]